MLASVKFSAAVSSLLECRINGYQKGSVPWSAAVEVGPHPALKAPFQQVAAASASEAAAGIAYTGLLSRGQHAVETAMAAAGLLWSLGHPVDLGRVNEEHGTADSLHVLTTLPPYAWNHAKGFWHEPAAARGARLRSSPRTDLLGAPVPNQNPMQPAWRNFLQISESPWIKEHVITGTVLYPAAGMLVMAIEAALQMASKPVLGIRFRHVHFDKGLVVPAGDQAVEVSLSVKPHDRLANWFRYTVFSVSAEGSWVKHSWGKFAILHRDQAAAVDDEVHQGAAWAHQPEPESSGGPANVRRLDPAAFYDQLQSIGIEYGASFRNLTSVDVLEGKRKATVTFAIPDTKSIMPHNYEYPHLVHPVMLDAIFHSIYAALGNGSPIKEAAIPQRIADLFVSADLPSGPGAKLAGVSHVSSTSARGAVGSIYVSDEARSGPKIVIRDMAMTNVSSAAAGPAPTLASSAGSRRTGHLSWKRDVDFLDRERAECVMAAEAHEKAGLSNAAAELSVWLDLACHKRADLKVLLLHGPALRTDGLGLLARFGPIAGERRGFQSCTVIGTDEDSVALLRKSLADAGVEAICEAVDASANRLDRIRDSGKYDLVLAFADFDAGGDQALLSLSRNLVSPGGHLALLTACKESGPVPSEEQVKAAGFSRLVAVVDHPSSQLVIASAPTDTYPSVHASELFILQHAGASPAVKLFTSNLSKRLDALGIRAETCGLADVDRLGGKVIISLLEAEEPLVVSWSAREFERFRKLVLSARYILWITRGGLLDAGERSLQFAPTTGLLRTLRVEMPQTVLPHLDVSPSIDLADEEAVLPVLAAFRSSSEGPAHGKNDMEFAASTSGLFIPRVQAADALDREILLSYITN
ncbi:Beta-ketoacyl synthase [Macrophomina phaseolina MS6]|uniref:Beta-ketoacyl synthase n=1 Tax=Macrophomina phaseolina (strain MS6) TaxID=1126212 RepID=K2RYA9_MACPH|nr:Beta-ketoacyl synthase [Macrophomina phaseolina MS6]